MRIRDPGWKKFGSGIWDGKNSDPKWKKFGSGINIPDPQHCSDGKDVDLEVMEGSFDVAHVIDEDPSVGGAHRHHHPVQLEVQGRAGSLQRNI